MDAKIRDLRGIDTFTARTFSGFKKSQALQQYSRAIAEGQVERACYYSADLVAAGHLLPLWESILIAGAQHAHAGGCGVPVYISRRYEVFKKIMEEDVPDDLAARNHTEIRRLFAEVSSVLATGQHSMPFVRVNVDAANDFSVDVMARRFRAPDLSYGKPIHQDEDPPELFPAVNELVYALTGPSCDELSALYWIEWILGYCAIRRKQKRPIGAASRRPRLGTKLSSHIVWIIWDVFKHLAEAADPRLTAAIRGIEDLFAIRFSVGAVGRRRFLLYWASHLLTTWRAQKEESPLIRDVAKVRAAVSNIDRVYGELTKFCEAPSETLLRKGVSSGEKARAKLALLSRAGEPD